MNKTHYLLILPYARSLKLALLLLFISCTATSKQFLSYEFKDHKLDIKTDAGSLIFEPLTEAAIAVSFENPDVKQLPSFAIDENLKKTRFNLNVSENRLTLTGGALEVVITKQPFNVQFFAANTLLLEHAAGFFHHDGLRGVNFNITDEEKFIGGGQRVLGMDRRGHKLPLYNKAHWGYTSESKQMYFGLPAVISSKGYALIFDNSARGAMDLGANVGNRLQFEANAGRNAYIVVAGATSEGAEYPKLIDRLTQVTGKQPLPPRWTLGNFASRFGYRSEQQVRDMVKQFTALDIPLDAVVLDLYWFGKDMKGHMGNLDWDREHWPTAETMIADFKQQGIQTVVITEPFILQTSKNWQSALDAGALAKDMSGEQVKAFDMYFGRAGLVDVFDVRGQRWFWDKYRNIINDGVAGLWGDLGEPEMHPTDTLHAIGTADEVHNAYGHQWAKLVSDNFYQDFPNRRLFLLMRSGFMGSQRYGMIPWTGDVSRSWGGLKPQIELSLQMGMMGFGYTHSDLGGFGGDKDMFDKEMYIRWMQYGAFQPVYRPHGFETVAPEPVFHDQQTQDIVRQFIKLRYRLLPYNYSLAYENAVNGMPLMRPLMFADLTDNRLFEQKDSFLWGDSFLVHPVTDPEISELTTLLPGGVWFDFWRGTEFSGGKDITVPVSLQDIPVFVKAGSFIPYGSDIATTARYQNTPLQIHYYHHASVAQSQGRLYEDDGVNPHAIKREQFLHTQITSEFDGDQLRISLSPKGLGFPGLPEKRRLQFTLHNLTLPQMDRITVIERGNTVSHQIEKPKHFHLSSDLAVKSLASFTLSFDWHNKPLTIDIPFRAEPKESP